MALAVAAFRAALSAIIREQAPLAWAATQNRLGAALEFLGERESGSGTKRLVEAAKAYREALKESTRERAPQEWALAYSNLAGVSTMLDTSKTAAARLQEAVAAQREALNAHFAHREQPFRGIVNTCFGTS